MTTKYLIRLCCVLAVAALMIGGTGCPLIDHAVITSKFEKSLHGTREGKRTWYEGTAEQPGFFSLTGVPYDTMPCKDCHAATLADGTPVDPATYVPGCGDCHIDPDNPTANAVDAPAVCLGCHSRQGAEIGLSGSPNETIAARFTDVHRDAGMICTDCHGVDELHGDGNAYASMLSSPGVKCEDCHGNAEKGMPLPDPAPPEHTQHMANIDCSACHVQTVVSCYNCHFKSEVDADIKRFFGPPPMNGFLFLVNRTSDGKVHPASFQSLTYEGWKFAAIGAFYGHTITEEGRTCSDCHGNAAVQEYNDTGEIVITSFDNETKTLTGPAGVIPIPPDFQTALKFDFLDYTAEDLGPTDPVFQPDLWEALPGDADLIQMLDELVTPLTPSQMSSLSIPFGS